MEFKYCLLAAGPGSRNSYACDSHKALLPVANRAAISHLLGQLDSAHELVIAVNHRQELLREYLAIAHPEWSVRYVEVERIDGEGSGPGFSLLACREYLDAPFVLLNSDSYLAESLPDPDHNWVGVASVKSPEPYCLFAISDGLVSYILDKRSAGEIVALGESLEQVLDSAFTGLAGIHDHQNFWHSLEEGEPGANGELQVAAGLSALQANGLQTHSLSSWSDLGSDDAYLASLQQVGGGQFLIKPGEFVYLEGRQVIKFYADPVMTVRRVERAGRLKTLVPKISVQSDHFYAYLYQPGCLLTEVSNIEVFNNLLEQLRPTLFTPITLEPEQQVEFFDQCRSFYETKSRQRIDQYRQANGVGDNDWWVNGEAVPGVATLLDKIPWENLSEGVPGLFHGDFQPENIVITDDGGTTLIDWRQDFAGETRWGDIYYDLAKLYHALIISAPVIRANNYAVEIKGEQVELSFQLKSNLLEFLRHFDGFIINNGWDLKRVRILTGLIYLNIAPLHHHPYSELLYYYGLRFLNRALNDRELLP